MEENKRLLSLDAFRGFDMMFIMGIAGIITAICALFPNGSHCWLATQMTHVDWEGLRHHDTIFPTFLFIAGISFPFSYAKQLSKGATRWQIYRKIIYRGLMLCFLGLVYNGFFDLKFSTLRYGSVLARIGVSWMLAALLFINFGTKARAWISAGVLVGYYLLMKFVTAPDFPGASPWSVEGNIAGYIDRVVMPNHLPYFDGLMEPEGLLSHLPGMVTAMLGMFTGEFVRLPEEKISGNRKTLYMLGAAAAMLAVGLLWSLDFPCIKQLWTSTFVLIVGSYSLAMFAIFYWIIDVKGWKKWTTFFTVIGMNSITIYMAQRIFKFGTISGFFTNGLSHLLSKPAGDLVYRIGAFTVAWLFLYFLYRKKVFLKI